MHITYARDGTTHTATIVAGKASADRRSCVAAHGSTAGITCLGITSQEFVTYQFPITVKIDTERVGGPSAGLAFALQVYATLGHNVTRGYKVAATGQIQLDGTVAPIGGAAQKAIGVRRAGVGIFLVPAGDNARDAKLHAGAVRVIPVQSFQQALRILATLPRKH